MLRLPSISGCQVSAAPAKSHIHGVQPCEITFSCFPRRWRWPNEAVTRYFSQILKTSHMSKVHFSLHLPLNQNTPKTTTESKVLRLPRNSPKCPWHHNENAVKESTLGPVSLHETAVETADPDEHPRSNPACNTYYKNPYSVSTLFGG